MKRQMKKAMTIALALLMVIQIIPLNAYASEKSKLSALEQPAKESNIASIECELLTERTEFSKTFLLKDGSYATYISAKPIHKEDKNGNLKDIESIGSVKNVADVQSKLSKESKSIQERSNGNNPTNSIVAGDSDLTYSTIGNGISGIGSDELRIQQYDENAFSQIYSAGYVKLSNINLPDIGDECIITYATFSAWCQNLYSNVNNATNIVTAQIVNDQWPSGGNIEHPIDNGVLDYNIISSSDEDYYEWDITEAACGWSNDTLDNNGIALTPYDNNCKISAYADSMILYYKVVDELDDEFSYHSVDMGRAGIAYINDFTRDFYLVRDELSINGNILPVSLTRTFNNSKNTNVTAAGTGWHWNYVSTLNRVRISNDYYYKWVKDDGSIIYFEEVNNSWVEQGNENGYSLTLGNTQNTISSNDDNYSYIFGVNSHRLEEIVDNNNHTMTFDYDTNYGLSKVTDGVGRKFVLSGTTINGNGYVNSMSLKDSSNNNITLDQANIALEYTYNNNSNVSLNTVTYADNEVVEYTYDSNNNLYEITNIDGTTLEITYDDYGKVISYEKYASNGTTVLESVTIDASEAYQRLFTDNNNTITRQQFDTKLNVISEITRNDGYFNEYDENNELVSRSVTEDHENLLSNDDFSDGLSHWSYPQNRDVQVVTDSNSGFKNGSCDNSVVKIKGYPESVNYVKQTYEFESGYNFTNKVFTVGAWAKIRGSVPRADGANERTIGVLIADSVSNQVIATIPFDSSILDWQYNMVSFVIPNNTSGIQIALVYNHQIGYAMYDGITLYRSNESYVKDVTPIPIGCNCSSCIEPNCGCTCLNENDCHCASCQRGISTTNNSNGLPITEEITDGSSSMLSTKSYTANGNYLLSSTDVNDVTTYYTYDANTGVLNSIALGVSTDTVAYTYNSVGLLKTVSQTVTNAVSNSNVNMTSSYSYDGDTISSITHNGMTYSFEYDIYGNVSSVSLNNTDIKSISYTNSGENIGSISYANGKALLYEYNNVGNITKIYAATVDGNGDFENQTLRFQYTYNGNTLTQVKDILSNTVTKYDDDVCSVYHIDIIDEEEEETLLYSFTDTESSNSFDININTADFCFNQTTPTESYNNNNGITTTSTNTQITRTLSDNTSSTDIYSSSTNTDYYGRTLISSYGKTNEQISTSFTYKSNGNYTTNLIDTSTTTIGNEQYVYEYEYDDAGRLVSKELNNNVVQEFTYDEAGQLLTDKNYDTNTIYTYSYDAGGNINSVVSDVISGTSNPSAETFTNVNDRLTNYNGIPIQYDENGNMLNDDYLTYEWNENNQIKQASRSTQNGIDYFRYKYNDSGFLVSKTNYYYKNSTGVESQKNSWEYYWDGDKLVGQKYVQQGRKALYYYDSDGRRRTVYFNGGTYYSKILYNDCDEPIGFTVIKSTAVNSDEISATYYYIKDATGQINSVVSASDSSKYLNLYYDGFGYMEDCLGNEPTAYYCSPLFYKDYLYDFDADLYHCQSRHYNPYIQRFLSMDSVYDTNNGTPNSNNTYSYCENDPVNRADPTGYLSVDKAKNQLIKLLKKYIKYIQVYKYDKYIDFQIPNKRVNYVINQLDSMVSILTIVVGGSTVISAVSTIVAALSGNVGAGTIAGAAALLAGSATIAAGYVGLVKSRIAVHYNNCNITVRLKNNGTFKVYEKWLHK